MLGSSKDSVGLTVKLLEELPGLYTVQVPCDDWRLPAVE